MEKLIKEIRKIINYKENSSGDVKFQLFTDNSMCFLIYEVEVPIIIDIKNQLVSLDCETFDNILTSDMLKEIYQIVFLLEKNMNVFNDMIAE